MPKATVSHALQYTFGPGQDEGIDNVTAQVAVEVADPFTGAVTLQSASITVQQPNAGWDEASVLDALQAKLPTFEVVWAEV